MILKLKEYLEMFDLKGILSCLKWNVLYQKNIQNHHLLSVKFVQDAMVAALYILFHLILKTTLK